LILNFYPAKIFLGESGSTFAGFMLGVLAIVSGGKIATAILVMGIPLLDVIMGDFAANFQPPVAVYRGSPAFAFPAVSTLDFPNRRLYCSYML
jgi:hypothetical protein